MKKNAFAELFYEQCAGVTSGHMAHIPNNPVLFSMLSAATGSSATTYACSKVEFSEFLRCAADMLESPEPHE